MDQATTWTLIYIGQGGTSPQAFVASGDPQQAALALDRKHEWLRDFQLVAAVAGTPTLRLMDDARTGERGLLACG
jgi:hypothetical protein